MTCEEIQKAFSSYLDDQLSLSERAACDAHLQDCLVCRAQISEARLVLRRLRTLKRPAIPSNLAASINDALMIERAAMLRQPRLPLHVRVAEWLEPRVMPYTIGAFASILLFVAIYAPLHPYLVTLRQMETQSRGATEAFTPPTWVNDGGGFDVTKPLVSLEGYAASRLPYGVESPSLNPRGALAALVWNPSYGQPDDDDMIVVADVFSNGSASLAEVVQPPRNRRMLNDLQDALRKNPAFVPAALDQRPKTMRVVFVLQKVEVPETAF